MSGQGGGRGLWNSYYLSPFLTDADTEQAMDEDGYRPTAID